MQDKKPAKTAQVQSLRFTACAFSANVAHSKCTSATDIFAILVEHSSGGDIAWGTNIATPRLDTTCIRQRAFG